jgi:phage FluMu protein Com
MIDVRCPKCNKLLFRASSPTAQIEIQCHSCKLLISWPSLLPEIKPSSIENKTRSFSPR